MISLALSGFSVALPSRMLFSIPELELGEGESAAILGRTGVGKSVLLRSLAGLLPVAPFITAGEARVLGIEAYKNGRKASFRDWRSARERGLIYVPPEPALALNQGLTLSQNLALFGEEGAGRAEGYLDSYFGLRWKDFERRYPDEVSGGELQRVSLAILLSKRGSLILLDEPTVSLDSELRLAFVDFINSELLGGGAAGGFSRTILLASHDLDFVDALAFSRRLGLVEGRLAAVCREEQAEGRHRAIPATRRPVLELRDLSQAYIARGVFGAKRKTVFEGLFASFGSSRIYSVLGPSGCGKTSLFKALLRLVSLTKGRVDFEGVDLLGLKPTELGRDPPEFRPYRRRMGIVLQDSRFAFLPDRSVASTLRIVFKKAGINPGLGMERALALLPALDLEEAQLFADPLSLSSGEAKRMDLLRVLACDFDALLLDEPFAHIDFQTRLVVMEAVEKWLAERERLLIAVTHEEFDILHFSDECLDFLSLQGYARKVAAVGTGNGEGGTP